MLSKKNNFFHQMRTYINVAMRHRYRKKRKKNIRKFWVVKK